MHSVWQSIYTETVRKTYLEERTVEVHSWEDFRYGPLTFQNKRGEGLDGVKIMQFGLLLLNKSTD